MGDPTFDVPLQRHALLGGGGGVDHHPSPPDHHGPLQKWELDDGEPLPHLPVQQRQNQEDAARVSPGGWGTASSTGESLSGCDRSGEVQGGLGEKEWVTCRVRRVSFSLDSCHREKHVSFERRGLGAHCSCI